MPAYTAVYSCRLVREGSIKTESKINSTERARSVACKMLRDLPNEKMIVILLDTNLRVIGTTEVTSGILDASLVHPREFFRPAIICNAAAVIAVHNHPSGDLSPSAQDRDLSNRLVEAGKLLGIQVMDFLIVNSDDEVLSFADEGLLR